MTRTPAVPGPDRPARAAGDPGARPATVRRVRPADGARMRALRLEMLADSPLAFLETIADAAARPHADYCARIAAVSAGCHTAQFVADPGGRLVGHAGGVAVPQEPGLTVVYAVYVTPARRGAGLLGDLVEAVAAWSRSCGRPELMLEVVVGNDRAYRAYQKLGFTDTGVRVPHPTVPALQELQMRRPA
ncbi:GNAT family N-acetyltransferase [Micromonospora siamensis]|uniref:GNAT family N-acetyltransferase n=1 Tax=Micromonospora siamensis TaxID=299152 RepID=UPI000B5AEBF2